MHIGSITIHGAAYAKADTNSGVVWVSVGAFDGGSFMTAVNVFIEGHNALSKAVRIAAAFNAIMAEDVVKGEPAPTPLAAE